MKILAVAVLCILGGALPALAQTGPSVVTYGAVCNSNGTSGNGTDDSAAFVTADAAGLGWTVPTNSKCRIATNHSFLGPATIGGQIVVDAGHKITFTGTMNSYGRNPFPIAGTIQLGYDSNAGLVGNTVANIWGPWTMPGPILLSDSPFTPPTAPAQAGDMMGAQALTTTGSISVYRDFLWGYGNSAVGLGVTAGASPAQPMCAAGTLGSDPSVAGSYPGGDTVGLCVQNFGSPPWLYRVPGTISGNVFTPTSPFSAAQLQKFHQYELVDTSLDTPPCAGPITSWDPAGANVTVQGWYVGNVFGPHPATVCTPISSNTLTIRSTTIYGADIVARRNADSQQTSTVGLEIDVVNQTLVHEVQPDNGGYLNTFGTNGLNASPSDIGLFIAGEGNSISTGILIQGATTLDGVLVQSNVELAAFHASPLNAVIENAFMADDNYSVYPNNRLGNALLAIAPVHTIYSTDRASNPGFVVDYHGNMDVGTQYLTGPGRGAVVLPPPPPPAANSPIWRFYSSASSSTTSIDPDSIIQFSGGSGALDGTITITAGSVVIPLPMACTGKPAGTFFVSGGFVKQC